VICSFLKETGVAKEPVVGGFEYDLSPFASDGIEIPMWLFNALEVRYVTDGTITARQLKTALNL
jgi:hypothetical protein